MFICGKMVTNGRLGIGGWVGFQGVKNKQRTRLVDHCQICINLLNHPCNKTSCKDTFANIRIVGRQKHQTSSLQLTERHTRMLKTLDCD